jgi:hypothetical protein
MEDPTQGGCLEAIIRAFFGMALVMLTLIVLL